MIVNSHNIEFGYELISCVPYAYYLHSKGLLEKTISGVDSEPLYYFSPKHEINPARRDWHNTMKCQDVPNINIHKAYLDESQFLPPPYKEIYKNDLFDFGREIVIICNRHNIEWSVKPINYFDNNTLHELFYLLEDKYQVIYINIAGCPELYDNEDPIPLGDYEVVKQHPRVLNIHDLHRAHKDKSFNTLQMMLFANCDKFITMNGGHGILASYFGGENIIMSKPGKVMARELQEQVNSFYRWYYKFSGQRVVHVPDEIKLLERVKLQWIDKEPIANILVRTSCRPNYFENCMKSILSQTYKNVNIWVSVERGERDYTVKYPVYPITVERKRNIEPIHNNPNYGIPFPANLYLNDLQDKVKDGLILIMDDDDCFTGVDSLQTIMTEYKKGHNLIFWQVRIQKQIVPSPENWNKRPVVCDVSMIGFAYDSNLREFAEWDAYKRVDFRVSSKLYDNTNNISWIKQQLTMTQNGSGMGRRIDLQEKKNENDNDMKIKVEIIKDRFNNMKLNHKIGEVKEVEESIAHQLIKHGIAIKWYEHVKVLDIKPKPIVKEAKTEYKSMDEVFDIMKKEHTNVKETVKKIDNSLHNVQEMSQNVQENVQISKDIIQKEKKTRQKRTRKSK